MIAFIRICGLLLAILAGAGVVAQAGSLCDGQEDTPSVDYAALGQEIVREVEQRFYDPQRAHEWAKIHAAYANQVRTQQEFARLTKQALAELKASHTAYYTPQEVEYYGLFSIFARTLKVPAPECDSIGADFARLPEGFFVRTVFTQSPAGKAGLLRGDRVVSADGQAFDPFLSFQGRSGKEVLLQVEREAGKPALEKRVTPRRIKAREEWLEAQRLGSRLIEWHGKRVAYVPFFSGSGIEYQELLEESLQTTLSSAGALILDFRNGWGGCDPKFVNLFNSNVPILTQIPRGEKEPFTMGPWRKPVVLLINHGSRSGKEAVAFGMKKHKLATLVGQRTAGAVLGGTARLLSDRSLLYLAVVDIRVDGELLEGKGVEPDIAVTDVLPYAGGKDVQLEKALAVAEEHLRRGQ